MSGIVTVTCLFGSAEEAQRVARKLVEERLAACANILAPCRSVYRWEGAVQEADEVPVHLKTAAATAPALIARLAALHSYDVPAITLEAVADAHPPYARWVAENSAAERLA